MIDKNAAHHRLLKALKFLEAKGLRINQPEIEEKTKLRQPHLSAMINGESSRLTEKNLRRFASFYSAYINDDWLVTGEGDMERSKDEEEQPTPEISYSEGVPYYDVDFLAGFEDIYSPDAPHPEYLIKMPGYEKATLWCKVTGHSMEPEISQGDIIALKHIEDFSFLPYGDIYGIITHNGMRTIKRLGRASRPGYYNLIPTNKEYDAQEIALGNIAIVYRVMGAMKPF